MIIGQKNYVNNEVTVMNSGLLLKIRLALASVGFFTVLSAVVTYAQGTNPTTTNVSYYTKHINSAGDPVLLKNNTLEVAPPQGKWMPMMKNWNGKNTSKVGNKIENVDTSKCAFGFSIPIDNSKGGTEMVTVTAATSDAAWEEVMYIPSAGWTKESSSAFDQNCYGYATGLGYWIEVAGFQTLANDDYNEEKYHLCVSDAVLKHNVDHASRLDKCCDKGLSGMVNTITTMSEKSGTSGVYKYSWNCKSGGSGPAPNPPTGSGTYFAGKAKIYVKKP